MLGPCEYLVELQIIVNYVAWSLWPSVKTYIYVDEVLPNVFTFSMLMLYLWGALECLSNVVILVEQPEYPMLTYKIHHPFSWSRLIGIYHDQFVTKIK